VPLRRNPHFAFRDDVLADLDRRLAARGAATVVLYGAPGRGKTQIAVEYAYRHAAQYDAVWWIRAEEVGTLVEDLAALAPGLGVRANARDLLGTASRVRAALEQGRGWLLILDNAEQPQAIRPFLPTGGEGAILVTSRNPDWPFAVAVPLAPFGAEAAGQFLLNETKQVDTAAAATLAQQLGGLPLALAQAAALVTRSGSRLADYAKLLEEHHAGT
jgi:hypothetical protein